MKVFWSWQSDAPGNIGRFFVCERLAHLLVMRVMRAASRSALGMGQVVFGPRGAVAGNVLLKRGEQGYRTSQS